MSDELVKLNLGAGGIDLPGFTPIDRKDGKEVYPLSDYKDGTVEEIYASHILEHFSHREVPQVLTEWMRVLAPGGCLRVAVPNMDWMIKQVTNEVPVPIPMQSYIMGGQADENDFHKTIFDRDTLLELMINSGFERIGEWAPIIKDCASLDVSLNLMGYKPTRPIGQPEGIYAVLSCPRFGPLIHMQCAMGAFAQLHIGWHMGQSAYWSHMLSMLMETCIAESKCRYVLATDYDTIFTAQDVLELYRLMEALPEWDALMPLQQKRSGDEILAGIFANSGAMRKQFYVSEFEQHVTQAKHGHFGLTMFRADKLRELSKPWMTETPDPTGSWGAGRVDPDIDFWRTWKKAGNTLGLANRVVTGHLQEMITWPNRGMKPVFQYVADYQTDGIPKEAQR